jgi:glycosyltransferase involved in cell wall biosynthesis
MDVARAPARICFPFVGDSIGGSHLSALMLIEALDRRRFEPVVALHQDGPLAAHLRERGVGFVLLRLPGLFGQDVRDLFKFRQVGAAFREIGRFVRRTGVSLVHTNDTRMHQTWTAPTRLAGRPSLWHQRLRFKGSRAHHLAMLAASEVVCISSYARSTLPPRQARRAAIVLDPYDVDCAPPPRADARAALLRAMGFGDDCAVVGFCGVLSRQKRIETFIDAAAAIAGRLERPVAFAALGSDRDGRLPELQARADRLGVGSRIRFLGFRLPAEPQLAGMDVLLAPAVDEAYGRVLVEAMLVGTPVVAARSGAHPEVVQDGVAGMLAPADDPARMAEACLALLRDPQRARAMALAARQWARERHGVTPHRDALEAIYRRLLAPS